MRFEDGYPCDTYSTDKNDSPRLNGMMVLCDVPGFIDLNMYRVGNDLVRYIGHDIKDMSRDQILPLCAAYKYLNEMDVNFEYAIQLLIDKKVAPNGDWLSPTHIGFLKSCLGQRVNWYERIFIEADIVWSTKIKPYGESNQILAILMVLGNSYLRKYCKMHPDWKEPIISYWSKSWRKELDVATAIVKKVESLIK